MAGKTTSLVGRVAWGSALAAAAAALIAALATIAFAALLLGQAEDRRLEEAAKTFATELENDGISPDAIRQVYRSESEEMEHTGILFAVYDGQGRLLAGDRRLMPPRTGCVTSHATSLRVCSVRSANGVTAVAGAAHTSSLPLLGSAAMLAVLLAAAVAWIVSRPISTYLTAPLTRLRERVADLQVDEISEADLGPSENVAEVDALRMTIAQLVSRVEHALSQAQRFAANAAHELRTPLTSVIGELELLGESIAEPTVRANASHAHQKLTELATLVERLLILSVPARNTKDAHEVVSLRDVLEDAVSELPAAERGRVYLSEADATVRGDAVLLATMVHNALCNGLKFGTHVTTSIESDGSRVVLRIEDDGPGIAQADREHVFEPFFRTPGALQRRLPGHGLGLALVRHVAQTHGGDAGFTDNPTGGTRLEIWLATGAPL